MNKAFVRESDDGPTRCPQCGTPGIAVRAETLAAQISAAAQRRVSDAAFFCGFETCPVVYFDAFGGTVLREEFTGSIVGKDWDAPLCACFGLTRDDVEADVAEGGVTRTKAAVLRAQSDEARCQTRAPHGQSCLSAVQGYYLKCRNG